MEATSGGNRKSLAGGWPKNSRKSLKMTSGMATSHGESYGWFQKLGHVGGHLCGWSTSPEGGRRPLKRARKLLWQCKSEEENGIAGGDCGAASAGAGLEVVMMVVL